MPRGTGSPQSLDEALRAAVLELVQRSGSVLFSDLLVWASDLRYSERETRQAVDELLRAGQIETRPYLLGEPEEASGFDLELLRPGLNREGRG